MKFQQMQQLTEILKGNEIYGEMAFLISITLIDAYLLSNGLAFTLTGY